MCGVKLDEHAAAPAVSPGVLSDRGSGLITLMWDAKDVDALLTSGWETQPRRAGAFQWRTLRPLFDGREGGSSNKTAWCTDRSLSGCYQMET